MAATSPRSRGPQAAVLYRVEAASLAAHLFRVTLTIARPAREQIVALPVWIPGSYLIREFAKQLQGLSARQGRRAVTVEQLDKSSWRVTCEAGKPVTLSYEVYAWDNSVRMAFLDERRGFFNGTSLFLRVPGQEDAVHEVELSAKGLPARWQVATALPARRVDKRGFGTFAAANYDELVDSPFELGTFWSGRFEARGVEHRFVVAGAPPAFDGERLLADTRKICEAAMALWHPVSGRKKGAASEVPPHSHYLFMLNAVDDGYGGLEHRASTALICNRRDLPRSGVARQPEGYTTLLGLISHEYFHTWNVKRLRPVEFTRYRYDAENYTRLLWFFEGFTSYYDDLLLRRAGLLDDSGYLKQLNKTINQVMQTPGRAVQSVAEASFDAWVKYYRPDENTPNHTVSYYTKGALIALCLDLRLRAESRRDGLDAVMRALWRSCAGGPMSEADLRDALTNVGGRSYGEEIEQWVHGRDELPLEDLLRRHGVNVFKDPAQLAQALGLRVTETQGVQIKAVLRGGAAEAAGMAAGDEWLAVDDWRLGKLDELALYAGPRKRVKALVARDRQLLRLDLTLPPATPTWRLGVADSARLAKWLAP